MEKAELVVNLLQAPNLVVLGEKINQKQELEITKIFFAAF
jgi:hypothetical protein